MRQLSLENLHTASSTATRGNTKWPGDSTGARGSNACRRGSGWWGWDRGRIGRLMQEARDRYRAGTMHVGADEKLVRQWAEWQALMMTPITPHWAEAMWEVLGKPGCIVQARWPKSSIAEDPQITASGEYLFEVAHSIAAALVNRGKKKPAKGAPPAELEKPNQVNLYVALSFPRWMEIVLDLLRAHLDPTTMHKSAYERELESDGYHKHPRVDRKTPTPEDVARMFDQVPGAPEEHHKRHPKKGRKGSRVAPEGGPRPPRESLMTKVVRTASGTIVSSRGSPSSARQPAAPPPTPLSSHRHAPTLRPASPHRALPAPRPPLTAARRAPRGSVLPVQQQRLGVAVAASALRGRAPGRHRVQVLKPRAAVAPDVSPLGSQQGKPRILRDLSTRGTQGSRVARAETARCSVHR